MSVDLEICHASNMLEGHEGQYQLLGSECSALVRPSPARPGYVAGYLLERRCNHILFIYSCLIMENAACHRYEHSQGLTRERVIRNMSVYIPEMSVDLEICH